MNCINIGFHTQLGAAAVVCIVIKHTASQQLKLRTVRHTVVCRHRVDRKAYRWSKLKIARASEEGC